MIKHYLICLLHGRYLKIVKWCKIIETDTTRYHYCFKNWDIIFFGDEDCVKTGKSTSIHRSGTVPSESAKALLLALCEKGDKNKYFQISVFSLEGVPIHLNGIHREFDETRIKKNLSTSLPLINFSDFFTSKCAS